MKAGTGVALISTCISATWAVMRFKGGKKMMRALVQIPGDGELTLEMYQLYLVRVGWPIRAKRSTALHLSRQMAHMIRGTARWS